MQWFQDLINQLVELGEEQYSWLLHIIQRFKADTNGVDVIVTSEGSFKVFWPISARAVMVCEAELRTFPIHWTGYQVPNAGSPDQLTWKQCFDHLERKQRLVMAWATDGRTTVMSLGIN